MRDPWTQAFLLLPPRICGVQLLPFSVAHEYILTEVHPNPYLYANTTPAWQDLFYVLQVCSRTWAENKVFLNGWMRPAQMRRLVRWSWWWRLTARFDVADASLKTYIGDYIYTPAHRKHHAPAEGSLHYLAAPHEWHLAQSLIEMGMTRDEAWNCPFNEAKCLYDVACEKNGDDTLMTETDKEVDRWMAVAADAYRRGDHEAEEAAYAEVNRLCHYRRVTREEVDV